MNRKFKVALLAVASGVVVSIGASTYLTLENKLIGAFMFTIGLIAIVLNGFYLFTGKVGYMLSVENKGEFAVEVGITWVGNLLGTALGAIALNQTKLVNLKETARVMVESKLDQSIISVFVLAVFCGILMFLAVDGYRKTKGMVVLFMCVAVFIICGFEHCIANMFYFTVSGTWSLKAVLYLLIASAGNGVGALLTAAVCKLKVEQEYQV